MAGSKAGGKQAAKTNKEKYGKDFYRNIGSMGGRTTADSGQLLKVGFASNLDRAREAGRRGGLKSKRKAVDKG